MPDYLNMASNPFVEDTTVQSNTRFVIFIAMVLLTVVSMWTTYVSLRDSILPEPLLPLPLGEGFVWQCSIFALALSVAIGLMLFALKIAIIEGEKRLGVLGLLGLCVVGFISISFNMDVLYRTADRDFYLRYSTDKMRSVYEQYLAEVQTALSAKRDELLKKVALQQGELESEIKGVRQAPSGYGPRAKEEEYALTLLEKSSEVDLASIEAAIKSKEEADALLRQSVPENINDIQKLQNDLRVLARNAGAAAGLPLPTPVKTESPLFAVFAKLFDFKNVGIKEIFFLIIAVFLDLGDIVGYSLVPSAKKKRTPLPANVRVLADSPEYVPAPPLELEEPEQDFFGERALTNLPAVREAEQATALPRRFRLRRR